MLLFTGRYFRYRKYRMKVYRVRFDKTGGDELYDKICYVCIALAIAIRSEFNHANGTYLECVLEQLHFMVE